MSSAQLTPPDDSRPSSFTLMVVLASSAFAAIGCDTIDSNLVDSREIRQELIVAYDEEAERFDARAEFTIEGELFVDTVRLVAPSAIRFEGLGMKERRSSHKHFEPYLTHYELHLPGPVHQRPLTFEYTDGEGRTYRNSFTVVPVKVLGSPSYLLAGEEIEYRVLPDRRHRGAKWEIVVTRPDAAPEVSCTVQADYRHKDGRIRAKGTHCPDTANGTGQVRLQLVRYEERKLRERARAGGKGRLEYRVTPLEATVHDYYDR